MLKKIGLILGVILLILAAALVYPIVPDTTSAASEGVSHLSPALSEAVQRFVDAHDTIDAIIIANSDQVLFESGITHEPINTHSVRKSVMSVLMGIASSRGDINVHSSLAELGIDDAVMPLTDLERTAKVTDLLKARSGIYIEAAGETAEMKAGRPRRGQYAPGEHYYYNNWDFNTLGSVLTRTTGRTLHAHMADLSTRLGFKDYQADHLFFSEASGSEHDQYILYLSARDLARIGQMMLRDGTDDAGRSLLSSEWITASTTAHSQLERSEPLDGYGYLWSLDSDAGTVWATGWGGQYLLIDRTNNLLIVTRNHTGRRLGAFLWLVALNNSTQGRAPEVASIHEMLLDSAITSP